MVPGLALHVDLGPDDFAGAGLGLVLGLLAAGSGFRVPVGGARAITEALLGASGRYAPLLQIARGFEIADPAGLSRIKAELSVDPAYANHALLQALATADSLQALI